MSAATTPTITLSAEYVEWAHRPASESGNAGAAEIIRQTGGRWKGRVKLTLTPEVVAELRSAAKSWAADDHDRKAVPWGFTRTARRILAEVPALPDERQWKETPS